MTKHNDQPDKRRRGLLGAALATAVNPLGVIGAAVSSAPAAAVATSVVASTVTPIVTPYIVGQVVTAMGLCCLERIDLGLYSADGSLENAQDEFWQKDTSGHPDTHGYESVYTGIITDSTHLYKVLSTMAACSDEDTFVERNKRKLLNVAAELYSARISGLLYCYQLKDDVLQAVDQHPVWNSARDNVLRAIDQRPAFGVSLSGSGGYSHFIRSRDLDGQQILWDIVGTTEEMLDFLEAVDHQMQVTDEAFEDVHNSFAYVLDRICDQTTQHKFEVMQAEVDDKKDPNGVLALPKLDQVHLMLEMMYAGSVSNFGRLDVFPLPEQAVEVMSLPEREIRRDRIESKIALARENDCSVPVYDTPDMFVPDAEMATRWTLLKEKLAGVITDRALSHKLPTPHQNPAAAEIADATRAASAVRTVSSIVDGTAQAVGGMARAAFAVVQVLGDQAKEANVPAAAPLAISHDPAQTLDDLMGAPAERERVVSGRVQGNQPG